MSEVISKPELNNVDLEPLLIEEINNDFNLIEKSATNFDPRYILRVFRELGPLRRKLTSEALYKAIDAKYPNDHPNKAYLLDNVRYENGSMEIDEGDRDKDNDVEMQGDQEILPELDIFTHLLVQIYLHDQNDLKKLNQLNKKVVIALKSYNRRTLDFIASKVWFYIARTNELLNKLVPIRSELLLALRTATLRHDNETRASTITLLLRNYLLTNDISQASNLVEKTEFPTTVSNSLVARYYYYLARITAIQLNYSDAHEFAISAIRKSPQSKFSTGFLQSATKLNIVVELLMGDIPELSTFRDPLLEQSLVPYLAVTKAVRLGDLNLFSSTLDKYSATLKKDDNYNLVLRLRQNVIKTGIRILSLSYSKISLRDICIKLHLDSELSAEYIVAKAIRDGVLDAEINHEEGFMQSKELLDVYSTKEPQEIYDARIKFCMSLHNDSVKAMRYPMNNNRINLKNDLESKEREQDLLNYLQDGSDFDFI
ncbi:hypothetical protein PACTADRAFT_74587 [Pachysolen tannophilus NRRL Y-2460]|uniref:PCI domain-containing protein n=1 Tax=Pachysolen tannophilus NRRL Y-2460 TaxID=669874 RepID=A0A1E4TZ32_PACTA|nr:hypothetical protein PACTADRAFT_74587 [Pachysolen tannophilus NRRL Y-2460]